MVLWPCEGGEKENRFQSRYQLPDSQNIFSSFSLISVQKCVKEGAGVAWVKYNIQAVVSREALREAYEVIMAFSLQALSWSPHQVFGEVFMKLPLQYLEGILCLMGESRTPHLSVDICRAIPSSLRIL